jgi:hypothetical protein
VADYLNTHVPAALCEAFPPQRALLQRLELQYTPTHGSWPNRAEIEITVFERGCRSRPVGYPPPVRRRVCALETGRDSARATIRWQFNSQQAPVTLAQLFPVTKNNPD